MKLIKGTKPTFDIPKGIPYTSITFSNGYVEIDIDDANEIAKLKSQGFIEQ